jgi:facilitated trehalose transporter
LTTLWVGHDLISFTRFFIDFHLKNHNEIKFYDSFQIVAALAVSLGPLAAGLGKGYSSPAIASLQELHIRNQHTNYTSFSVTDQEASWVASLSLLGALFGGMFGGLAMQYGRKRVLALMSLPFSLSWILTVFAKSVETMFMTAFIGGFCCAIVSMVTQVNLHKND